MAANPKSMPRPAARVPNRRPLQVIKPGDEVVLRAYKVVLVPEKDVEIEQVVTLRYPVGQAPDPTHIHTLREAFRRADRKERREHQVPNNRQFMNGGVTFLRERLAVAR